MQLKLERNNYGRVVLIAASLSIWLLVLLLLRTIGYHATWGLWKVPSWLPFFLDFRLIPGSAESFAHGYEPSVENPYDPTQRIFNYPAFWRIFFYTGITQDDTAWISISMIVLFFIGAFLFPQKLSIAGAIGMLFVLFSPASMLLYERGNVDLIVFVLCVMIVLASGYSAFLAAFLIAFSSIVKLFPFFGISVLLRETKNKFLVLLTVCFVILVLYMAATLDSVNAAWNFTMRGDGLSYGTNVFVTRYQTAISKVFLQWFEPHHTDLLLKYAPMAAGLILLILVVILGFLNPRQPQMASERNFAAFRMGASIYIGTFLLGNNFDYRLAFLVLVVPQLVEWMRTQNRVYRILAWLSMFLILISCWHLWIVEIPLMPVFQLSIEDSKKFWIVLDEVCNWALFASLAYLLFVSAPAWLKQLPDSLLPKGFLRTRPDHEQTRLPLS